MNRQCLQFTLGLFSDITYLTWDILASSVQWWIQPLWNNVGLFANLVAGLSDEMLGSHKSQHWAGFRVSGEGNVGASLFCGSSNDLLLEQSMRSKHVNSLATARQCENQCRQGRICRENANCGRGDVLSLVVEMQLALATGQEDSVMRESCNAWSVVLCAMVGAFIWLSCHHTPPWYHEYIGEHRNNRLMAQAMAMRFPVLFSPFITTRGLQCDKTRPGAALPLKWLGLMQSYLPPPPPSQPRLGTQLSQSRVFLLSLSSQTRTKDHTRFQRNLPAPLVSLVTVLRVLTSHCMQWWAAVMSCSPAPPTAGPAFRVLAQPTAVHMLSLNYSIIARTLDRGVFLSLHS